MEKLTMILDNDKSIDENVLDLVNRFKKFSPKDVFYLINSYIMENNIKIENEVSPKLLHNLCHIYASHFSLQEDIKKPSYALDLSKEWEYMAEKLKVIFSAYYDIAENLDMTEPDPHSDISGHAYMSTHFDYPSIRLDQYFNALSSCSNILDKVYQQFGLSSNDIINGFKTIILFEDFCNNNFLLRMGLFLVRFNKNTNYRGGLTVVPKVLLKMCLNKSGVKADAFVNYFFEDLYNHKETIIFPTKVNSQLKDKIGVEFDKYVFYPRNYYIVDKLWSHLLHDPSFVGFKDHFTENYCFGVLDKIFKAKVYKGLYDIEGNEQDIIVTYKKYVFVFECKSSPFGETFLDTERSLKRLRQIFKKNIQKAYEQGLRVKFRIRTKQAEYYDSDKRNSRNKVLDLNHFKENNVFLIAVTLNSYANLAGSVHKLINQIDPNTLPWVIDVFSLERIVDHTVKNESPDFLSKYIKDRIKSYGNVIAANSDELDYFGFYLKYRRFYGNERRNSYLTLGPGYSSFLND